MSQYDIVLFGATGFTGQLTAEYLQHASTEAGPQKDLKWAIAGRNAAKLAQVKEQYDLNADCITADVADSASISAMVAKAKLVITTVGPYLEYGEDLIRCCAEQGVHYVDLTGEPTFVYQMLAKYQDAAEASGAKIVNCCGFDSIPYDLGAQFAVEQLAEHISADIKECEVEVDGFIRARGGASGGTWHSALGIVGDLSTAAQAKRAVKDIFAGLAGREIKRANNKVVRNKVLGRYGVPLPTIDPDVVARSAAELSSYGKSFQYNHYASVKRLTTILAAGLGLGSVVGLAQLSAGRKLLGYFLKPGDGPDENARASNWFELTLIAKTGEQQVICKVNGGDPGYGETSKMLAESALAIVFDTPNKRSGFLTPALAAGSALRERLHKAGMTFTVQ